MSIVSSSGYTFRHCYTADGRMIDPQYNKAIIGTRIDLVQYGGRTRGSHLRRHGSNGNARCCTYKRGANCVGNWEDG